MEHSSKRAHRLRLCLYALLLLLVMLLIFYMSGKSGSDSQRMSDQFSDSLWGRFLAQILPLLTDNVRTSLRKYAHIFEFFCLGVSSFLFFYELFWTKGKRLFKTVLTASLWSFLYACSDEWHQTFVPERAGRLSDLRFDAAGFLPGIALLCFILWLRRKKRDSVPL